MSVKKKSWTEKLNDVKDLPKIEQLSGKQAAKWGEVTMYIPSPPQVDAKMRSVKKGKLITINEIRKQLAAEHHTGITCPITTGIFCWIAANASKEQEELGKKRVTPYWRTLKNGGVINEKYPGGTTLQKKILEAEGFTIIKKGKQFVVKNFENYL